MVPVVSMPLPVGLIVTLKPVALTMPVNTPAPVTLITWPVLAGVKFMLPSIPLVPDELTVIVLPLLTATFNASVLELLIVIVPPVAPVPEAVADILPLM